MESLFMKNESLINEWLSVAESDLELSRRGKLSKKLDMKYCVFLLSNLRKNH